MNLKEVVDKIEKMARSRMRQQEVVPLNQFRSPKKNQKKNHFSD